MLVTYLMGYRFQKLSTVYPVVAERLFAQLPNHDQLTYRELYDAVKGLYFAWSDYYAGHMRELGNEADNVFANIEPLQKAWAREQGLKSNSRYWLRDIAIEQVRKFQPEVIFLEDLYLFDEDFRQRLRAACRRPVWLVGHRAAPTDNYKAFSDMDLMLTCVPNFARRLTESGARVGVLRHAFEPAILDALGPLPPRDLDFSFTGHIVLQDGYHQQRRQIIEQLLDATPLEMWVQISEPPPKGAARIAAQWSHRARRVLHKVGVMGAQQRSTEPESEYANRLERTFPGRLHRPVFGLDNFRVLGRSRVTFNNHIDAAENHAGNMRLFEATGMGACLLTDWKADLGEIFEPDKEVITYRSADECTEKIKYLMTHDRERAAIAAAGQRRTLSEHTFSQRAAQLDDMLRDLMAKGKSAAAAVSLPRAN